MALASNTSHCSPSRKSSAATGCHAASPAGAFSGEVQGTATGGTVWAWFMQSCPPQAGAEDKAIWRDDGPNTAHVPIFNLNGPRKARDQLRASTAINNTAARND